MYHYQSQIWEMIGVSDEVIGKILVKFVPQTYYYKNPKLGFVDNIIGKICVNIKCIIVKIPRLRNIW